MLRTLSLLLLIVTVGYSQWRDSSRVLVPAPSGKAVKVTQFAIGDTNTWKVSGAIAYMGGNFYIANGTYYVLMAGSGSSSADTATFVTKNTTQVVSAPKYFTARQYMTSLNVDTIYESVVFRGIGDFTDDFQKINQIQSRSLQIGDINGAGNTSYLSLDDVDRSVTSYNTRYIRFNGGHSLFAGDTVAVGGGYGDGVIKLWDNTNGVWLQMEADDLAFGFGGADISNATWVASVIDTTYLAAVSKITGGYGLTVTKNAKDYTVTVDSATLRSKFVPYSGANAAVDLGVQNITTVGSGSFKSVRGTDSVYTASGDSWMGAESAGQTPRLAYVKQTGYAPEIRFLSSSPSTFTIRRVTGGTVLSPTASTVDMVIGATGNVTWGGGNHLGMGTLSTNGSILARNNTGGISYQLVGDSTNNAKDITWYTRNRGGDSARWTIRVNSAETEASAGAGSNFSIIGRDDVGNYVGEVLSATRSTGALTLGSYGSGTLSFKTNNTVRWYIGATGGALTPNVDSSYDVGGSSNYVKNLYVKGGYIGGYLAASSPTISEVTRVNSATNSAVTGILLRSTTSGTSASGYGGYISMYNKDADNVDRSIAAIYWTALGGAKNTGRLGFYTSTGGVSGLRMNIDSAGINIQSLPLTMNGTAVISSAGKFSPAGLATVGPYGVSGQVDTITYAGIASGISKNLTSTAGMYRLVYTMFCTTADAAAGSVQLTLSFNNGAAQTMTSAAVNLTSTANKDDDAFIFYVASGTPSISTAITGSAGTSKYSVHAVVERLK